MKLQVKLINKPKDYKKYKINPHDNPFKRINATINVLINKIAGMGVRTNKRQDIINYM
jgi:hypothetical protein